MSTLTCSWVLRMTEVFCDWLDVTFAPDNCPYPDANRLLLDAGFEVHPAQDHSKHLYLPPKPLRGAVVIRHTARWASISASGGAIAYLRDCSRWMDYLFVLSTSPHTVTRVDVAADLSIDGPDLLDSLRSRHSCGHVNLGRKAIKTSVMLETRPDGRETGTWYAGHRSKARLTARAYDKAYELLTKYGELIPPRSRVEITARKGFGATLRDAALPEALFWHAASPTILQAPEGVPVWQPNHDMCWTAKPPAFDPAAILRRRVESLVELDALLLLAEDLGPSGRDYLLELIRKRLKAPATASGTASSAA